MRSSLASFASATSFRSNIPLCDLACVRIIYVRMPLEESRNSLNSERPREDWWDAKGDWTKAHESAQQDEGPAGAWVDAYLHRKEGDVSNAGYWYRQAGKPQANVSLDEEWVEIVSSLLAGS
jgi:hypothetical protein